jgi:choline dehydrogenase-like flavoprotein
LQLFARAVGQAGFGVVRIDPEIEAGSAQPNPGSHHMGTTRMARSPEHGVVDGDCAVFGIPNLFVAGSSVFPLGGCANPTLTIVALALRLADHIASTARH